MEYIDNLINDDKFYNIFDKKIEPLKTYTDLMKYFVGKRLLPILCNELNDNQFGSFLSVPTPALNGQEDVYCLGNDDTMLTDRTALRFSPTNNIWDCIVLCKAIGYTEKQQPEYRVIAKATLKFNPETGNVYFSYQSSNEARFQPDIDYFNKKTTDLLVDIIGKFNSAPLIAALRDYKTIDDFKHEFLRRFNDEFKHQNLGQFKTYFNLKDDTVSLMLRNGEKSLADDQINLFSYNAALNKVDQVENAFYDGEIVLRNEWESPVSGEVHHSTPEEVKASQLLVKMIESEFKNNKFIRQDID